MCHEVKDHQRDERKKRGNESRETSDYRPAAIIRPYPTVITTPNDIRLAGIPRLRKCRTRRYRCPVSGTSIMMAAMGDRHVSQIYFWALGNVC